MSDQIIQTTGQNSEPETKPSLNEGNGKKTKKKILLGCLFGVLGAGAVTAGVVVPLKCCNNGKGQSELEFGVEAKEYSIDSDNSVTITITCSDTTKEHTLTDISLHNGTTQLGDPIKTATITNGKVGVKFTNISGFTGKTEAAYVTFKYEDASKKIENITVKKVGSITVTSSKELTNDNLTVEAKGPAGAVLTGLKLVKDRTVCYH
ncbi:MAG: hypothetical protein MJ223_03580 [Mycoplasmoidaceae bacterium]|nr:hypothetical protein [Mycoplasmoidaceae bacterium]